MRVILCLIMEFGLLFNYSDWFIRIIMVVIIFIGLYSLGIRFVGCIMYIKENWEG